MKSYNSTGIISLKGPYNMVYRICVIEYTLWEDETFKYKFTPNYAVIDLLDSKYFQGIPGLDLDAKKDVYIRTENVPVFISERVPQENREDFFDLLEEVEMDYMDPILYLIRTKKQYSGDNLFVEAYQKKEIVNINDFDINLNNNSLIKEILKNICLGNDVLANDQIINDDNRKEIYKLLLGIYSRSIESRKTLQKRGIEKAKEEHKYKGRKPISVDVLKFLDLSDKVEKKKMSPRSAASELGISIDKYYRFKKQIKNNNYIVKENIK